MARGPRSATPPGRTARPSPEPVVVDRRIGAYRVHALLGDGGMGAVFLARRVVPREGPPVALKRLHADRADDPNSRSMFIDEARLQMRLAHPAFCNVVDVGEADGLPYFAMDLLVGRTLDDLIRRQRHRPLLRSVGAIAHAFAQVCGGLHALHELGGATGAQYAVHRDISPGNLFVCYDGRVKILDLGIAFWRDRFHATPDGEVKGKMAYLAPEALEVGAPDRRRDVWSLGVTLWEALTGRRLFEGRGASELFHAIRSAPIPRPSSLRDGVPGALDEVVSRALSRDPEGRYRDAAAFGVALRQVTGTSTRADVGAWIDTQFEGEAPKTFRAIERLLASEPTTADSAVPRLRWDALRQRATPTTLTEP